jgi:hypothetical protein
MTAMEIRLIALLGGPRKMSDAAVRAALGVDQAALLRLGESVRGKLGLAPGASIRDALRRRNVASSN